MEESCKAPFGLCAGKEASPLPFPLGEHTSGYDGSPVFKPSTQNKALKTLIALRLPQEAPKDLPGAGLPGHPLCGQMAPQRCPYPNSWKL